ncbi:NAD(P)H-dependent oxidoreductase [Tenacibaculum sp. IB213877]|uniref:NAD(P)H-dependent oxidoreductase n=1 Tax=Tenacibaculum sp. IB213877 TaxID=3097351 RepID=UPI002A5A3688|nr:NAD(P)H-dependent oxidoreductase [Tenacibaculum sp. IB213877]MDY0781039.1 NAD(P)H-dependent oxidoreductase [Tenacibaculum sp. IB213877]
MNTVESLQWRYAVKKFDENKYLTDTQLNTLKEAFNLTASSFGLQPVSLVVVKNKEIQQQLVEHSWNQQQIVQASHLLVFAIPVEHTEKDVEKYFSLVKEIRNTPDEILNPFKEYLMGSFSGKTQEELYQWNKNQAYIALGNLLTVCAIEGIDSCPMEGFIPEKYDEILDLKSKNLQSVLVLPVGFRAEDDFMKDLKKVRKPVNEAVLHID